MSKKMKVVVVIEILVFVIGLSAYVWWQSLKYQKTIGTFTPEEKKLLLEKFKTEIPTVFFRISFIP